MQNSPTLAIAQKYKVAEEFGVTEVIATSIVKKALQTLLTPDERKELYTPRVRESQRAAGLRDKELGVKLFGRSPEKMRADSQRAGTAAKEKGTGIFAMTREQLSELGKKAGNAPREGGWFKRKIVDGMDEGTYALSLLSDPEFKPVSGPPDYTKIMEAVNAKYGNNRSRSATKGFYENERVREKKKKQDQ
jgi:general stress protein YciG